MKPAAITRTLDHFVRRIRLILSPDVQPIATKSVLEQAEVLFAECAAWESARTSAAQGW